jgi:hypothetical protein
MQNSKLTFLDTHQMPLAWHRFFPEHATSRMPAITRPRRGMGYKTGCQRQVVVLTGDGKRDYPFPTADELVAMAIAYFNELQAQYEKQGSRLVIGEPDEAQEGDVLNVTATARFPQQSLGIGYVGRIRTRFGICAIVDRVRGSAAGKRKSPRKDGNDKAAPASQAPAPTTDASPAPAPVVADQDGIKVPIIITNKDGTTTDTGAVLRIAVGTLAHIMEMGREEAVVARTFDPLRGRVNNALYFLPKHLHPEKYKETAESLRDQLDRLIEVVRPSLPRVKQYLKAQFPTASEEELLDVAISLLNEQLRDILTVLSIWTEAFAQMSDGLYPELGYLQFMLAQSLRLFQAGDAFAQKPGVKVKALHMDDLFMVRYSDQGPAAIPGSRGPVGSHMIMTPMYERRISIIDLPIYGHEFFHPFYFDVPGLADEMTKTVVKAIRDAGEKNAYKFSKDMQLLGKQEVPTLELMAQIFGQTLAEKTADIVGGVSLSGEAYGYSILSVFGAFNVGTDSAILANSLLSSDSIYGVGPNGELVFEDHLPDIIRVMAIALTLQKFGFHEKAREFEALAEQAAGLPMPKHFTWTNVNPRSPFKFEIKLAASDLRQVMSVAIDTILNAKLEALNNRCMSELVNWTPKRQEMTYALVANLLKGSSQIPWEMGDFYAPYVGAAAIIAVWTLWKSGKMPPLMATDFIETHARKMMDQVREHFEKAEAAAAAEAIAKGEPTGEPVEESAATDKEGGESEATTAGGPEGDEDLTDEVENESPPAA